MKDSPNYINHIAFVIDASASMGYHSKNVVKVTDAEIAFLAQRSRELDQETRVTVYTFNSEIECVIYDKDVLRLPSIAQFYRPAGLTALINATMQSQLDLAKTAQLYGDHAFLTYVITDGHDNISSKWGPAALQNELNGQPDNWTVACLVPDQRSVFSAKGLGFPAANIAVWDTKSADGIIEVGATIRTATTTFMDNRVKGIRGSKTIFAGGADAVNREKVNARRGFRPLDKSTYRIETINMSDAVEIRPFVEDVTNKPYRKGSAYYELVKPEKIQPQKNILIRNRRSGRVYAGADARALLVLPDHEVRVKPEPNSEFQIFVQSTSVNRKLHPKTKVLILNS